MQISNVTDAHIAKLEKKYAVGKKVRARIIGFRVMDALAIVSLKVVCTSYHCTFFTVAGYLHSENLLFIISLCFGIHCFELVNAVQRSLLILRLTYSNSVSILKFRNLW